MYLQICRDLIYRGMEIFIKDLIYIETEGVDAGGATHNSVGASVCTIFLKCNTIISLYQ